MKSLCGITYVTQPKVKLTIYTTTGNQFAGLFSVDEVEATMNVLAK